MESSETLKATAMQGDATAQYNLGVNYYSGNGVEKNAIEAVKWYRKASEQGHAGAQFALASCCFDGAGLNFGRLTAVMRHVAAMCHGFATWRYGLSAVVSLIWPKSFPFFDVLEGIKWCTLAAQQGHAGAQNMLGHWYSHAYRRRPDPIAAADWHRRAAEQGLAKAQLSFAYCCKFGDGTEKDMRSAVAWCRKAAEQGYAPAQSQLGFWYASPNAVDGCIEVSETDSFGWYWKALEQGDTTAQVWLLNMVGRFFNDNRQHPFPAKELTCCLQSAANGNREVYTAITHWGSGCYGGHPWRPRFVTFMVSLFFHEALYWFPEARRRNESMQSQAAWRTKGGQLAYGDNFTEDQEVRFAVWHILAKDGDFLAQYKLGGCYLHGEGVAPDPELAVRWFRRAAKHGLALAHAALADCYAHGAGVPKDRMQALAWTLKAARLDYAPAQWQLGRYHRELVAAFAHPIAGIALGAVYGVCGLVASVVILICEPTGVSSQFYLSFPGLYENAQLAHTLSCFCFTALLSGVLLCIIRHPLGSLVIQGVTGRVKAGQGGPSESRGGWGGA